MARGMAGELYEAWGSPTPAYRHYASQQDRAFLCQISLCLSAIRRMGFPELDTYSVAYLAGREKHLALAVVTKLLEQGYLKHVGEYGVLLPIDHSLWMQWLWKRRL